MTLSLILNQFHESSKILGYSIEDKYMKEDESFKMDQYNALQCMSTNMIVHDISMYEIYIRFGIIHKL